MLVILYYSGLSYKNGLFLDRIVSYYYFMLLNVEIVIDNLFLQNLSPYLLLGQLNTEILEYIGYISYRMAIKVFSHIILYTVLRFSPYGMKHLIAIKSNVTVR